MERLQSHTGDAFCVRWLIGQESHDERDNARPRLLRHRTQDRGQCRIASLVEA